MLIYTSSNGGFIMEYENKEICKKCGGFCCKKSGCDYFVSDFGFITKGKIIEALETGNVSIVSAFMPAKLPNGEEGIMPFLYLRARNKDRDIVDLFSMKKECSMLTETGCMYSLEERPGGGKNLIPGINHLKELDCKPYLNPVTEMLKWKPYQNLLIKIVKRYTGKTVKEILEADVERVCFEFLTGQTDGVSPLELIDMRDTLKDIMPYFPESFKKAQNKANAIKKLTIKKTTD